MSGSILDNNLVRATPGARKLVRMLRECGFVFKEFDQGTQNLTLPRAGYEFIIQGHQFWDIPTLTTCLREAMRALESSTMSNFYHDIGNLMGERNKTLYGKAA